MRAYFDVVVRKYNVKSVDMINHEDLMRKRCLVSNVNVIVMSVSFVIMIISNDNNEQRRLKSSVTKGQINTASLLIYLA
jgi:hypothetical protein